MPHLTIPFGADGPILSVMVGVDGREMATLRSAGKLIPPPLLARGLIDTGTNITSIARAVLSQLPLVSMGQHSTQTASGMLTVNLFEVSFSILGPQSGQGPLLVLPQLLVMELSQPLSDAEVLIGRDVLSNGLFMYDGRGSQFHLSD